MNYGQVFGELQPTAQSSSSSLQKCLSLANCSRFQEAILGLILLTFFFASIPTAFGAATVSGSVSVANAPRAGIDVSGEVYWGTAIASNIFANPGFEQPVFGQNITVKSGTASVITSEQDSGDGSNAWAGATCTVRVGTCSDGSNNFCYSPTSGASVANGGCAGGVADCNAGTTFTLSGSTSGPNGDTFSCSGACPTLAAPAPNSIVSGANNADIVSCVQTVPVTGSNFATYAGWGPGYPTISIENTTVYDGKSALEFNNATSAQTISQLWDNVTTGNTPNTCVSHPADICTTNNDCPSGDTCSGGVPALQHPVTGNWTFSFYANTSSSGATCTGNFYRGSTANSYFSHSTSLTSDGKWHQYTYNFTGTDTSATKPAVMNFNFTCNGGVIYVDDMYLGQSNPTTAFTSAVISELQAMNVGDVRAADTFNIQSRNPALSESVQLSSNRYQMPPEGGWISQGIVYNEEYSFADLVTLARAISSTTNTWMTIPMGWTDAEYTAFGNQLCSWETTYNFPQMSVECNNENWNGGGGPFDTADATEPAYGMACGRAFALISAACSDSRIKYFLNEQIGNSGVMAGVYAGFASMPNSSQYGFSEAPYPSSATDLAGDTIANAISNTMNANYSGNFAGPFAAGNRWNDLGQLCENSTQTAALSPCNRIFGGYEFSSQNASQDAKTLSSEVNAGWGGASIAMQTFILGLTVPPPAQAWVAQHLFQLNQPNNAGVFRFSATAAYSGTDENFAPVWPWLNGQGLGLELYNKAVVVDSDQNGDYHAVTGLPSGVYCAAFAHSSTNNYQLACVNTNTTPTAVSVAFPSGANVPTIADTVNYTNGMADNNENSASLSIGSLSGGVSYNGQTGTFTIPALGTVALLTSSGSPTPTPTRSATPTSTPTVTATATATPTPDPVVLQVSPTSLNFGSVTVGSESAPQSLTLTNPSRAAVTNIQVAIQAPLSLSTGSCGPSVAAGSSCVLTVTFAPQHPGVRNGSITITDSASNSPQVVSVSGTAVRVAAGGSVFTAVQSQPVSAAVRPIGIDLSGEASFGSKALQSNILANPGFEPVVNERVIDVTDASSSSFCETNSGQLFPADFYAGASFEVVDSSVSAGIGARGKIAGYDPTGSGCSNGAPRWDYVAGFPVEAGDIVVTHTPGDLPTVDQGCSKQPSCGPVAMWWFEDDPQWITSTDQNPYHQGSQSIQLNLDGNTHELDYYFGVSSLPVKSRWKFTIYSKSVDATEPSCTATLRQIGKAPYCSHTWMPGQDWTQTAVSFVREDTEAQVSGVADLSISCLGTDGVIRLDDAYLGPAASDGGWRAEAVAALKELHPGYIRARQSPGGDDYASFLVYPAEAQGSITKVSNFIGTYSLEQIFDLSSRVGAEPWVSIPVTFSDAEYNALGEQIGALQRKYMFPEVVLEFGGNEAVSGYGSSSLQQNGGFGVAAYAARANRAFGLIGRAAGLGANLKYAGNAQLQTDAVFGSGAGRMAGLLSEAEYIALSPYWGCQESTLFVNDENQCNRVGVDPSSIASMVADVQAYARQLAFVDGVPEPSSGLTADSPAAIGSSLSVASQVQSILEALGAGVRVMISSASLETAGGSAQFLGNSASANSLSAAVMKLMNQHVIGGDFYTVNGGSAGVAIGAFLQSDGWHIAAANSNAESSTVSLAFPDARAPLPAHIETITNMAVTNGRVASRPAMAIVNTKVAINSPTSIGFTVPADGVVIGFP